MTPKSRRLAVVTGASSGIGLELAKELLRHDFDLIIAADGDGIHAVAEELGRGPARVRAVQTDLRTYEGVESLYAAILATGRPLDAALLNAGTAKGGAFVDNDLADELALVELNVTSTVHLAKRVLRDMVRRDSGRILITSSIAATMPGSFHAVYNASKSFLLSFAEALQNELRDSAVTVTVLMPGPTETSLFARAQMLDTVVGQMSKDDPVEVAKQGVRGMLAGRKKVVAESSLTKAQALLNGVLPNSAKAGMHRIVAAPRSRAVVAAWRRVASWRGPWSGTA
jgi:short-subunit dehydrogenase